MRMLLSTTALAVALGLPTVMLAQATTGDTATQSQSGEMSGFLGARGPSDILASELMGQDVHARRMGATGGETTTEEAADQPEIQSEAGSDAPGAMTTTTRTNLDDMDNIGQINEIVLSGDGQIRAIVIGVGGFLGMGERDVALTMDRVTFAQDPDDRSRTFVIVDTDMEMLEASPEYDRTAMVEDMSTDRAAASARDDTAATDGMASDDTAPADGMASDSMASDRAAAPADDREAFARPEMTRDGYDQLEATRVSSDMLIGSTVYDVDDNSVGNVDDLIMDSDGAITDVVIDFGGFLGIGSSQVALGFDELTVLSNDRGSSVRVYVDATRDQIQSLPEYRAVN